MITKYSVLKNIKILSLFSFQFSYPNFNLQCHRNTHFGLLYNTKYNHSSQNQSSKNEKEDVRQNAQELSKRKQERRLRELKQKQKQQIKYIKNRVSLTSSNYHPLYLKSQKMLTIGLILIGCFSYLIIKVIKTVGVFQFQQLDSNKQQIKKQQKLALISEKKQNQQISFHILKIYSHSYQILEKGYLSQSLKQKIQLLQQSLIHLLQHSFQIITINSDQPIILSLPNNKILISNSLLRNNILYQSQLQLLILLTQQLFNQRYHITTLVLTQILSFWRPTSGFGQIKLRQIYAKIYKCQQICNEIQIMKIKMKNKGKVIKDSDIEGMFRKLKKMNDQIVSKDVYLVKQNIYQRFHKIEQHIKL